MLYENLTDITRMSSLKCCTNVTPIFNDYLPKFVSIEFRTKCDIEAVFSRNLDNTASTLAVFSLQDFFVFCFFK